MTTRSTRSPRRRTMVALAIVLAVLAGFVVRLVDIQVVNADQHIQDSKFAFAGSQKLYGTRGSIVDDSGQTLAGSILRYDCQVNPLLITQVDADVLEKKSKSRLWADVSDDVAEILDETPEDVRAIVGDALADNAESQYAKLKNGISTEQYRALADLKTPYIFCAAHPARAYPDGAVAGNLLGFMGTDGEALEGLEKSENSCLAATNGERTYDKGNDGVVIPGTEKDDPPTDGGTLQLTIDRDLQWYLQQLIAEQTQNMVAQHGSILVYEVKTGKVRAAAEYPTVDPNNVDGTPDPDNRASQIFRGTFEPGSTFKGLTAATLIDAGGQSPTSTVVASSEEHFADGARVRDAFKHPAYTYTLAGVLIDSSNAGISKFSQKLDKQTRYDYFKRFGIGEGTDTGYPMEGHGLVYPADEWGAQTTLNTSFGQGVTTTMPELARAYGAIVGGGTLMPLQIIESCTKPDGTVVKPEVAEPERVISESTSAQMREMLENVFLQANYSKAVAIPGYRIGGKTGTGEKSDGHGGYKSGVYYTTMVGFAPADDPEYVVVVTLDEPTKVTSSAANATAFQKAMTQVLKTYRVMPSTTSPVLLPKFG